MIKEEDKITINGTVETICKNEHKLEEDRFGNTIKFQVFQGRNYASVYDPSILAGIRDVEMRPSDVYLPSFPRTGTHWAYEMIGMLLKGEATVISHFKGTRQAEFQSNDDLRKLTSPRIITSHMRLSDAPQQLLSAKCKVVYPLRDPKDVVFSLYTVYKDLGMECNCSFEGFFDLFTEGRVEAGGIFGHYRDAERFSNEHPEIPFHVQIYEETHKDPVLAVQKLSDFLELPRDDNLCRAIAEKCNFSNMLVEKDKYALKVDGRNVCYRKGTVGDWKNHFSKTMLESYYQAFEDEMKGSKFYELYARK